MYEMLTGEAPFYSDDIPKMYQNIQKAQLSIPKNLSEEAKNLLTVKNIVLKKLKYRRNYWIEIQTKDQGLKIKMI